MKCMVLTFVVMMNIQWLEFTMHLMLARSIVCSIAAPVDYRAEGGRLLTFDATSTSQTVEISVTDDSVSEGTEQFVATLNFVGNVGNGVQLEPNEATVQITDDDRMSLHPLPTTPIETAVHMHFAIIVPHKLLVSKSIHTFPYFTYHVKFSLKHLLLSTIIAS